MKSLTEAYEECRRLNKYYGTPFFHAINSFPRHVLPYLHSVYAFDRVVHEILYNPKDGVSRHKQARAVQRWQQAFEEGLDRCDASNQYLRAAIHTVKVFDIPPRHFAGYTQAKLRDFQTDTFDTFAQLVKSIDGTYGRLALINGQILGIKRQKAQKVMTNLARAAQLVFYISKLGKDFERKNRCILPAKDLKKFGYSLSDFKKHKINKKWKQLIEHYLKKIQNELDYARKNIKHLPAGSQPAMENTVQIYESLIESIRKKDYDVFSYQPRLSSSLKLRHMLPSLGSLLR